jgi:ring-1,2-phenylacetyl-CoA epoxidase subunit PaaD
MQNGKPYPATEQKVWDILRNVNDPEVPVLSITDLGIVRDVKINDDKISVIITPTYSGCPAMDVIAMDIRLKMIENGYRNVSVDMQLSPAWTTEWMSEEGKQKLKNFGIAPPNSKQHSCATDLFADEMVNCPRCDSVHTELVSRFGSTACKSLYRCLDCKEPFDHFKCH